MRIACKENIEMLFVFRSLLHPTGQRVLKQNVQVIDYG